MSDHPLLIDTADGLEHLARALRGSPWLAVDTEFLRERTYHPRLCLVQVATDDLVACIDPLAIDDLDPLWQRLLDPATVVVLHAARQDLELVYHLTGRLPAQVFDTQLAATVLGQGDQVGYARLVKDLLDIDLDKSQTRTDWCRRPLTRAQLDYAADDVRHLRTIYHAQRRQLAELGREDWLTADFAALGDPDAYRPDPRGAWQRVRGQQKLKPRQRAVLRELAAWRERLAEASDRPRRWVMKDDTLLALASQQPRDRGDLERVRGLDAATRDRHGDALLAAIADGRAVPGTDLPRVPRGPRLDEAQQALADTLMAVVRITGEANAISPSALASRKDLERLVAGDPDVPVLGGWRERVVGGDLRRLLAGDAALRVRDGRLELEP